MTRTAFRFVLISLVALSLTAQTIPTPEEFLGYKIGDRFTPHHKIVEYFDVLAKSSNLITHQKFGETYEHRPLTYAVLTSPANHAQLEAIRQRIGEINRPDLTTPARAEEIARTTPVLVWLAFGVHGNESSSAEAAMMVARRLLQNDAETAALRDAAIIIIDPLQNPDGRERYIQWFHRTRGLQPNSQPQAFEHMEPWPGGRYNHYLNDMNRDWSWLSQRETQARVELYQRWNPQVLVDFHEMSAESNYFFPPDADPINTNIDPGTEKWLERFGQANAEVFAQQGWPFFVAESFDLFYPGYGDSWPSLRGAIGMTYEMAGGGRAGTIIKREDDSVLTLADRADRHFTTALVTVRTAAANRADLLLHSYRALRNQYERPPATFLVLPTSQNFDRFVQLLTRQGIVVQSLPAATRIRATPLSGGAIETRAFPAGTAVINTRQPYGGLARTLLEKSPVINERFLSEQREKIEADEEDEFYDVTAWSLPLAQNLDAYTAGEAVSASAISPSSRAVMPQQPGKFGFLIDATDSQIYQALGALLREGIKFRVSSAEFTHGGRKFTRGTVLIQRGGNVADLDAVLGRLVQETGVKFVAIETPWSGGLALGSSKVEFIRDPKIAIVGGDGTDSTSFGMLWYTLDVENRIPHTVIPANRIRTIDLNEFRVIVLPDGSGYLNQIGKQGVERLQAWTRAGGALIAIKGASAFLRDKEVAMSQLKPWTPEKEESEDKDEEAAAEAEEEVDRYTDFRIPGAAFRTNMNERSYLTFGLPRSPAVMLEGSIAILPAAKRIDNIVTVVEKDPLISGFAWPESVERVKNSAYLVAEPYGSGSITSSGEARSHFS
jgi:hypothetical protein